MRKTLLVLLAACALALGGSGAAMAYNGGGHFGGGGHYGGGHYGGGHYGGGHYGGGYYRGGHYGGHYYGGGYHGGHYYGHGHGGVSFVFGLPLFPFPYYPYSYNRYSYSYSPPVVVDSYPEVVVDTPAPPRYRYYCTDPGGYYPYVEQCPTGWMRVVPRE